IDRLDGGAVYLGRREAALEALRWFTLGPRAFHVPGGASAVGAGKLQIDEIGNAGLDRAGAEFVGRDKPRKSGVDEGRFGWREKKTRARLCDRRLVGFARVPWHRTADR